MKFTEFSTYSVLVRVTAEDSTPGPLLRKLRSFGALPVGWSHGEGVPVSGDAIRIAEYFVNIATQLQVKADVFPGLHGDCAVAFYRDQKSVEVIVQGVQNTFGLRVEEGRGFQFKTLEARDNATQAEVVNRVVQLLSDAWKSLASSHCASLTGTNADSRMWYSSTHQESDKALLTAS